MSSTILSFNKLQKELSQLKDKPSLLLGNGFCISINRGFRYSSLFNYAERRMKEEAKRYFLKANDTNFENILRIIDNDTISKEEKRSLHNNILNAFLNAVLSVHGELWLKDLNIDNLYRFFSLFFSIYTINYDFWLYVILLTLNNEKYNACHYVDGFCDTCDDNDELLSYKENFCTYDGQVQFYHIHGGLHLATNKISSNDVFVLSKRHSTWKIKKKEGRDYYIYNAIHNFYRSYQDYYPNIVLEKSYEDKKAKIERYSYLSESFNSFSNIGNYLVIFGCSLTDSLDNHLVECIISNDKITRIYYGLYNEIEKNRIKTVFSNKQVVFYNAKDEVNFVLPTNSSKD